MGGEDLRLLSLAAIPMAFLVNYWMYSRASYRLKRETKYVMIFGGVMLGLGFISPSVVFSLGLAFGAFMSAWILVFVDQYRRGIEGED